MPTVNDNTFRLSVLSAALMFALSSPASALQDTESNDESEEQSAQQLRNLEVITVTSRRITENLQEVPVSVTALTENDIETANIENLEQVAKFSPNVTLEASRATNTTLTAYIRGIGQQDPLWGFEPGVGIYIDDVYMARPQGALLDVYDVSRIEVLRGPQGTLYGKNTIGGAIKYVTKRLKESDSVNVRGAVGSYNQRDLKASVSHELIADRVWIGGAVASLNRDGFGTYVGPVNEGVQNVNKDTFAYRLAFEAYLSDYVDLRVTYDRTRDDANNRGGHRMTDGFLTGEPPLDNVFDTRSGIDPTQQVNNEGISATLTWSINSDMEFKSITAKREGDTYTSIDFDNEQASLMEAPGTVYTDDQFSQEFQLTWVTDDFRGVAGLYYFDGEAFGSFDVDIFRDVFGGRTIGTRTIGSVSTESKAAYAQGTYQLNDAWAFTLGGRYTHEKKSTTSYFSQYNAAEGFGSYEEQVVSSDFTRSPSWSEFTPLVAVSYQATENAMLYGSWSSGFKSGGVDPRANMQVNPQSGTPFDPETVETIEFGIKSQWLNDRVRLNATFFNNDYSDQQVATSIVVDTTGDGNAETFAGQVLNAGKASSHGLEIESIAQLTDNLTVNLVYGYIDAQFDEFLTTDPETFEVIDVADSKVVSNTPRNTFTLGANYNVPFAGGDLTINPLVSRRSSIHLFEDPSPIDQEGYTLVDLNVVWHNQKGNWSFGLHGKNLTNEEYRVAGYFFPTLANSIIGYYGAPRTVTLSASYRF